MKNNHFSSLAEFLSPETIGLDLKTSTQEEAIKEMIASLEKAALVTDRTAVLEAILMRERLGSTACGAGVAIPHARIPGLKTLSVSLGISKKGIPCEASDHQPVKIFFLIVGPQENPDLYLKVLSQIVRMVKEEEWRNALLECTTPQEVLSLIQTQPV
ncbi:MAG: PTS sugar transporter subunit IIA [Chlamydiae bacterium]|nr:PTS sugar transporter subunit IIA [Chlamydiota bacterium]